MQFAQFYADIADEANKGSTLKDKIPRAVRMAVQFIEQNYTLEYMRRRERKTLSAAIVTLDDDIKEMKFVRLVTAATDGTESYIRVPRIDSEDLTRTELNADPCGYWLMGKEIQFDGFRTANPLSVVDIFATYYTDTHCIKPTDTHPLLRFFEGAVLTRTMMELAPYAREPDWLASYGQLWQTHQQTLTMAQDALDNSGDTAGWHMRLT